MSTLSYEVVGELSAPEDFIRYALQVYGEGEPIENVAAKRINIDELTARRGKTVTNVTLTLLIEETHRQNDTFVISGLGSINGEALQWLQIEVTDRARFDILD